MNVTTNKTTRVQTSVSWSAAITDDDGVQIASMTAKIDSVRPLGSYNFTVYNQSKYTENEDEISEAYATFREEFEEAVSDVTPVTTSEEGSDTVDEEGGLVS